MKRWYAVHFVLCISCCMAITKNVQAAEEAVIAPTITVGAKRQGTLTAKGEFTMY